MHLVHSVDFVTAEKSEFIKTWIFYNGHQGNLPNLCPKGNIIFVTLSRQKTLPSVPDSRRQSLPSDLLFKAIYYRNILENVVTDIQKYKKPMERISSNNKYRYRNRHKGTDNALSDISLYVNIYNNLSDIFIIKYTEGHFQNTSFAIFIKYY